MITMKFDKTQLDRLFKDAPKKFLVAAGTDIRTAARTFAAIAAKNTLPYGAYDQPPKHSVGKVQADIKRTQRYIDDLGSIWRDIKAVDPGLAAGFWEAVKAKKAGQSAEFTAWVLPKYLKEITAKTGITFGPVRANAHKSARTTPKRAVPQDYKPTHIVSTSEKSLTDYIAKKQKTIGAAKAGWAAAGKSIGGSISEREGIKAWYNTGRHRKSKGTHQLIRTETETFLKLINQVPWANVAFPASQKKVCGREFEPAFKKAIETRKAALAKAAFNRKSKRNG